MTYWNSPKRTMPVPEKHRSTGMQHGNKKFTLEIELCMVMERPRLGLLTEYPAHLYSCTQSTVRTIGFTQICLMALELRFLISWPDRIQVRRNFPDVFRKYYPRCRVIIDFTEFFIETTASLNSQALCWSDYKHHSTVKILVGITPNGSTSYLSEAYGGRASDRFIVEDCGFLKMLRPDDQVMADRGFKIDDQLAFY